MHKILKLIEQRSEQLHHNSLCRWIIEEESKHLSVEEVLSFTPEMLYFILGFRDILQNLEYSNPQNELEFLVNQHCLEDKNHWQWYLEDLQTLGFSTKIDDIWSDRSRPTRDLVYLCIYLIKKYRSAKCSLIIIECLEATFGVFMSSLQKRFSSSPSFTQLKFFGDTHLHQEMNHQLGHWIEESASQPENNGHSVLLNLQFTSEEEIEMMMATQLIFEQFELVFESWHNARGLFDRPMQPKPPLEIHLS